MWNAILAGSIRDDGPLPEVIGNVYDAQDKMRAVAKRATTVIALATQLHTIATGNLVPSYKVVGKNQVRPVFFYTVDMSEFAANKLANRGSLTAHSILTNVQDFVVTIERGLRRRDRARALNVCQNHGTISVPAFPCTASSIFSIDVITALPPLCLMNCTAASTLGPIEPAGKCPCSRYNDASAQVNVRRNFSSRFTVMQSDAFNLGGDNKDIHFHFFSQLCAG